MTQNNPLHAVVVLASYLQVALVQAANLFPDRMTPFHLFSILLASLRCLGRRNGETACAASCASCR